MTDISAIGPKELSSAWYASLQFVGSVHGHWLTPAHHHDSKLTINSTMHTCTCTCMCATAVSPKIGRREGRGGGGGTAELTTPTDV